MRLGGKGRYISLFCCHANANRRRKDVGRNVSVRCETVRDIPPKWEWKSVICKMSTPPAGRMNRSFHLLCGLNESNIFRLSERRTAPISHGMKICILKNYLALWLCYRHVYISYALQTQP